MVVFIMCGIRVCGENHFTITPHSGGSFTFGNDRVEFSSNHAVSGGGFFVAGGDDPVGSYGKGVHTCADAFRKAGMTDVSVRIYPLCRHEILNEINKEEIYGDIGEWIANKT